LRFRPYDGLSVDAYGYVSLFERDGQYQLYVQDMQPAGLGDLYLAFEQLKARLGAEGLFDPAHKRAIPLLPGRVAVITSASGAALRDILTVGGRRCPGLDVVILPVQVQGSEAAGQIARALGLAGEVPRVEVAILARGGGSIEELWPFNEEPVARAIRACAVPVVVGVGHETDVTIADMVADVRAPTPSAAAELVFADRAALRGQLGGLVFRLRGGLTSRAQAMRRRLDRAAGSPALMRPQHILAQRAQRIDQAVDRLGRAALNAGARRQLLLARLAGKLDAMSPLAVLGRGYAICTMVGDGSVVRDSSQARVDENVHVRLGRGRLTCRVLEGE
jgi:exodeoxyribonuclease VII large subunit